jgi:hypothetical protein
MFDRNDAGVDEGLKVCGKSRSCREVHKLINEQSGTRICGVRMEVEWCAKIMIKEQ